MTTPLRYDDFTITKKHRDIVASVAPAQFRDIQMFADIPGVSGQRVTETFEAGLFIQPLISNVRTQYSITQDITRSSLLVIATPVSTQQLTKMTPPMELLEAVRTLFANKRVTGMNGELYSDHEMASYEIDSNVARRLDVVIVQLSSTFREDR